MSQARSPHAPLRVACVGGGPGGLFFATQLRRRAPHAEVVVLERNQPEDAFGFGVVFSDATLQRIHDADPVLREALAEHGTHWDRIEVRRDGERRGFTGNGMAAIHRRTLLPLLQAGAVEAGVELRFGVDVADAPEGFDVVVGADGANSRVRERLLADGADLGHDVATATAKFIWFGTTHDVDGLTFVHRTGPHGAFAAHAYPLAPGISTFIVETDEQTWAAAGLDGFDPTTPPGVSDEVSRRYVEELFAPELDGAEVVANNSRWANFRTRRTARWHHGSTVLLGDAVHTAHFSVGSGTKMAMEDGIALAEVLAEATPASLDAAFAAYEQQRQPAVARIQDAARGGLAWWERFGRYSSAFDMTQFAFHFFSRSIDIGRIEPRDPELVAQVRTAWTDRHGAAALETPLPVGGTTLPGRVLGWDGAALLLDGTAVAPRDVEVVAGGDLHDRILRSEDLRLPPPAGQGRPTVLVVEPGEQLDAETAVLAGRADAVATRV